MKHVNALTRAQSRSTFNFLIVWQLVNIPRQKRGLNIAAQSGNWRSLARAHRCDLPHDLRRANTSRVASEASLMPAIASGSNPADIADIRIGTTTTFPTDASSLPCPRCASSATRLRSSNVRTSRLTVRRSNSLASRSPPSVGERPKTDNHADGITWDYAHFKRDEPGVKEMTPGRCTKGWQQPWGPST